MMAIEAAGATPTSHDLGPSRSMSIFPPRHLACCGLVYGGLTIDATGQADRRPSQPTLMAYITEVPTGEGKCSRRDADRSRPPLVGPPAPVTTLTEPVG